MKARTFRTKSTDADKWDTKWLDEFIGAPWEPEPGRENIEVNIRVRMPKEDERVIDMPASEDREIIGRRMKITKAMVKKYDMTKGCRGCVAANRNGNPVNHSEECRTRMMEAIGERGSNAER